jgi:hypothetical protein
MSAAKGLDLLALADVWFVLAIFFGRRRFEIVNRKKHARPARKTGSGSGEVKIGPDSKRLSETEAAFCNFNFLDCQPCQAQI